MKPGQHRSAWPLPGANRGGAQRKQKRAQAEAPGEEMQVFEVNGHDIPCTEQQYAVIELVAAAAEGTWVSGRDVLAIFDNKTWVRAAGLKILNAKLEKAKARVAGGKHGFRLENLEG